MGNETLLGKLTAPHQTERTKAVKAMAYTLYLSGKRPAVNAVGGALMAHAHWQTIVPGEVLSLSTGSYGRFVEDVLQTWQYMADGILS